MTGLKLTGTSRRGDRSICRKVGTFSQNKEFAKIKLQIRIKDGLEAKSSLSNPLILWGRG